MWDAVSGGNQIQSMVLQQSGGAPTNRLTSVTTSGITANYTYDSAGNVTNDGSHTYAYDAENRIVNVDGGATASYSYDISNQRYKKVTGGATTHYIWQASQVIAEHNGITGAVVTDYVYFGSRTIANVSGGSTQYLLSDRLSVRMKLDSSSIVLGRQAHLPFGEDFAESGTQEKHHFTSYERDGESGVDYAINRGYSPTAARFLSADPYRVSGYKVDPQSWNRYSYARNNPINKVDRFGLEDGDPEPFECTNCTMDVNGGGGVGWIDFGGGINVDQPADPIGGGGQVPVQPPPPPPPPPKITSLADLGRYWTGIRDWIMSKGSCGRKLASYMSRVNNLVNDSRLNLRDTVANPSLLSTITPWDSSTVGAHFAAGDIAATIFSARRHGTGALIRADIYLGSGFFASSSEWQAITFMHELLHVVLRAGDTQLQTTLGTGGRGITDWIDHGCP